MRYRECIPLIVPTMSLGSYQLIAVFARSARALHSSFYPSYNQAVMDAISFTNKQLVFYRDINKIDELRNINYMKANQSPTHYLSELSLAVNRLNSQINTKISEVPFYTVVPLPCNIRVDIDNSPF